MPEVTNDPRLISPTHVTSSSTASPDLTQPCGSFACGTVMSSGFTATTTLDFSVLGTSPAVSSTINKISSWLSPPRSTLIHRQQGSHDRFPFFPLTSLDAAP